MRTKRSISTALSLAARLPAQLLSQDQHGKVTASQFQDWMTHQGITYDTTPHGFMKYAQFMHAIGLLSKMPGSMQDIELPTRNGAGS